MALEDLTGPNKYISNLVNTNPLAADDRREGDDHIRGVKNVLKNTFPKLDGVVDLTPAEMSAAKGAVQKTGDSMTGALTVPPDLTINAQAAQNTNIVGRRVGVMRWNINLGDAAAESGSNAGSNFSINRYTDAGVLIEPAVTLSRSTGRAYVGRDLVVGAAAVGAGVSAGIIANATEGSLYMYGIESVSAAYKLMTQVSTGNVVLIANNQPKWTQELNGNFSLATGKGYQVGGGPWLDASDERIKEDVQPYMSGLDEILGLRPVSYRFKAQTGRGVERRFVRLIAQQAKQVMPELVSIDKGQVGELEFEDLHTLDEGPVLWALVNAVQTLHARVAKLEAMLQV